MKLQISIILLFIISLNKTFAQSDHLEPIDGILNAPNYEYEYHSNIREILLKDFDEYSQIRYIVTPSFEPEFALEITRDSTSKYYVNYHHTNKKIWRVKDKSSIEILKIKKGIPAESAILVEELFNKALAQTRYIHKDLIGGDGIRYYFFNNFESGTTWSPKQGTRMEQLVNICNDLIKFANSNEIDLAFDLKKRIKRLIRKIN